MLLKYLSTFTDDMLNSWGLIENSMGKYWFMLLLLFWSKQFLSQQILPALDLLLFFFNNNTRRL